MTGNTIVKVPGSKAAKCSMGRAGGEGSQGQRPGPEHGVMRALQQLPATACSCLRLVLDLQARHRLQSNSHTGYLKLSIAAGASSSGKWWFSDRP